MIFSIFSCVNGHLYIFSGKLQLSNFDILWFHLIQLWIFSNFPVTSTLKHELFRNILFKVQMFGNFPNIFFLLVFSLILFWSENIHYTISIVQLNLLRFVLMPRIWSTLVKCFTICSLEYLLCFLYLRIHFCHQS